jgi:hypothetical protein
MNANRLILKKSSFLFGAYTRSFRNAISNIYFLKHSISDTERPLKVTPASNTLEVKMACLKGRGSA